MDVEHDIADTHRSELDFVTERVCEQLREKLEEFETNYTEFYWYLWEQDSGNASS